MSSNYDTFIKTLEIAKHIAGTIEKDEFNNSKTATDIAEHLEAIHKIFGFNFQLNLQVNQPVKVILGNQVSNMKTTFIYEDN